MAATFIAFAIAAYLVGSIPFGKVIAALVARIDITQRGSGNIGATNVARALGMKWGIVTLALDILKGLVPMLLFALSAEGTGTAYSMSLAAVGLCGLLGHMFPLFLWFKGGKGVATALGVYLVMSPVSCLCALIVFILVVAVWDFISLGSIIGACTMPVLLILFGKPYPFVIASILIAILVFWKHRENLQRLMKGTEPKWRQQQASQPKSSSNRSNSSSE